MSKSSLRYSDETDRAYGLTGMAISLVLWDGEPMLSALSLDNDPGSGVEFTPVFGFSGNPRMTASLAWREMLKQYELSAAMIMGNAICRSYIGSARPLSSASTAALKALLRDEGREICQLEDDEIDLVYNKTYRYLDRVFTHSGVTQIARTFADELRNRRRMTAAEVFEGLAALSRL